MKQTRDKHVQVLIDDVDLLVIQGEQPLHIQLHYLLINNTHDERGIGEAKSK